MKLGVIGLGRMGANIARRLLQDGHECVVHDVDPAAMAELAAEGAVPAASLAHLAELLESSRVVWVMVPAALTDRVVRDVSAHLAAGDVVVDGGNSYYRDDVRRAAELAARGISYVDVGTSGGVWGLERGYCLMIGGERVAVEHLDPIFRTLAPGVGAAPRTAGRRRIDSTAEAGYLHCGPAGAGHFVKMVHNGIEYGLMAAYAEGLNILAGANVGAQSRTADAETAPLDDAEFYRYDFDLPEIAELWRRGSVVSSWLLDLAASALAASPRLQEDVGGVADSGEGRWTVHAAIDEGVPAPVLSAALYARFSSRGEADFADRVLSALRREFGGHGTARKAA